MREKNESQTSKSTLSIKRCQWATGNQLIINYHDKYERIVIAQLEKHITVSREVIINELRKSGLPKETAEAWHDLFADAGGRYRIVKDPEGFRVEMDTWLGVNRPLD